MPPCDHPPTREERLAAKLRENLRRRKAQERERHRAAADPPPPGAAGTPGGLPKREDGG